MEGFEVGCDQTKEGELLKEFERDGTWVLYRYVVRLQRIDSWTPEQILR
jgi:hypothetical protein